ncbi:MAG: RNA polymerase sigma factor [bacterium]|nr:RNA polymerase sigma factor [bacterium]
MQQRVCAVVTDEEYGRRLQTGDRGAVGVLVERHHAALIGYLYRMTGGDSALAEDLAQETFVRVLRFIAQYRYPRPFKAWLYAIATNIARNHYNSADQRHTLSADPDAPEPPDDSATLDDPLIHADDVRAVIRALAALPAHQRETIVLYYYQALSIAEIAETLAVPLGTIRSRLSLGIGRLREKMKEVDYAP